MDGLFVSAAIFGGLLMVGLAVEEGLKAIASSIRGLSK
jgi:hypothetical protein